MLFPVWSLGKETYFRHYQEVYSLTARGKGINLFSSSFPPEAKMNSAAWDSRPLPALSQSRPC